jgi:hypothetical protein
MVGLLRTQPTSTYTGTQRTNVDNCTRCNKRFSLSYVKGLPVMGARDLRRGSHTPGFIGPPGTKPDRTAQGPLGGPAAL